MACHRVAAAVFVIWLLIPCGLPQGSSLKGQKKILDILKRDIHNKHDLLFWDGFPKYHQLEYVLSLAWNNLIKTGETISPITLPKLIKVTFDYGIEQSISKLVESNYLYFKKLKRFENKTDEEVFDEAVRDAFQILRHWFHYKVPKWLRGYRKITCLN